MKKLIKAEIYHDGEYYCARCIDIDVFTQGKTIQEAVDNLKEAVELHLSDDPEGASDFVANPSLFTMMDVGEVHEVSQN